MVVSSDNNRANYSVKHIPIWLEVMEEGYLADSGEYEALEDMSEALDAYFQSVNEKPWAKVNPAKGEKHPAEFSARDVIRLLDEAKVEGKPENGFRSRKRKGQDTFSQEILEESETTRNIESKGDEARLQLQKAQNHLYKYLREKAVSKNSDVRKIEQ